MLCWINYLKSTLLEFQLSGLALHYSYFNFAKVRILMLPSICYKPKCAQKGTRLLYYLFTNLRTSNHALLSVNKRCVKTGHRTAPRGGGTDLERGYGDVRPWRPPFHASPAARKGPISSKRVSSQDPLLRKFGNFSLNSLNFHPNFSSQAPKFGNFQLTSPQIWKFSAHKPPFSEANVSSQAPHFGNPGRTPLPEKKLSAPPRDCTTSILVYLLDHKPCVNQHDLHPQNRSLISTVNFETVNYKTLVCIISRATDLVKFHFFP